MIAIMDITGIPSAFFVNIHIADIEPFYYNKLAREARQRLFYANGKFPNHRNNCIPIYKTLVPRMAVGLYGQWIKGWI